jgi:hypothetical protein
MVRHLNTSPAIGPPAWMRDVDFTSKRCVQAPAASSSRTPSHTSSPSAMSVPSVS